MTDIGKYLGALFAISLCGGQLSAQFTVTTVDGTSVQVADGAISQSATAGSGYSFGGIDVASIDRITFNALPQENPGTVVTPDPSTLIKPVAVLDVTGPNKESEALTRNVASAEYMMEIAGLPSFTTTSCADAVAGASLIIISSPILSGNKATFTQDETAMLINYVKSGGIVVSPAIEGNMTEDLKELFGISGHSSASKNYTSYTWTDLSRPDMIYFDTPEETTVSIGQISTVSATVSTATPLAYYDDDHEAIAVTCNELEKGAAYMCGFRWRDVVERLHLGKAMGVTGRSQTFSPYSDIPAFLIRAAITSRKPLSAWKFTSPGGYQAVLIPTHDCDSRTAYDEMHWMADYESSMGLNGHYFLTVHYFRQPLYLSQFYCDETLPAVRKLLDAGHTVGSHSVCHYPDFNVTERFPMTPFTPEAYAEYATRDMETGISTGSTLAEFQISKELLEKDFNINVRSFRSGHLCVNKNFPKAHVMSGYQFSSCYTAPSLHAQFPIPQRIDNSWEGETTGVLQIPLHFSDVYSGDETMNDDNWHEKPAQWFQVFNKLMDNYASSVILIHPNRQWKMEAEKMLVDMMDLRECGLYNFEDYGDFWNGRRDFKFDTFYDPESGKVTLSAKAADLAVNHALGIMIEGIADISSVTLIDENGTVHPVRVKSMPLGGFLVTQQH